MMERFRWHTGLYRQATSQQLQGSNDTPLFALLSLAESPLARYNSAASAARSLSHASDVEKVPVLWTSEDSKGKAETINMAVLADLLPGRHEGVFLDGIKVCSRAFWEPDRLQAKGPNFRHRATVQKMLMHRLDGEWKLAEALHE